MPMRNRKRVETRIIVTRLGLDLLRGASVNILQERNFGSILETQVITMAVALGQMENKPMPTSKLSEYVGIPRSTVIRKLQMLEAKGMMERAEHGSYVFTVAHLNRPQVWEFIEHAAQLIHSASKRLSKLDT